MASKARDIADLGSNDVLETSSTGLDVTGTVTADGLTVEQDIAGLLRNRFSNTNTSSNQQTDVNISNNGDNLYMGLHYSNGDNAFLDFRGASSFLFLDEGFEKMRLDSSGNLLAGTTDESLFNTSTSTGHNLYSNGAVAHAASSAAPGIFNRLSSDGPIVDIRKNGTTVGSIGAEGGDLVIGTGSTAGLQFNDATPTVRPWNMSANSRTDGVCDLGYSNSRFKDLYLSGEANIGGISIERVFSGDATGFNAGAVASTWHEVTAVDFNNSVFNNRKVRVGVTFTNHSVPYGFAGTAHAELTLSSSNLSGGYNGVASIGCSADGTMGYQLPLTAGTHTRAPSLVFEMKIEIVTGFKRLFIRSNITQQSAYTPTMTVDIIG